MRNSRQQFAPDTQVLETTIHQLVRFRSLWRIIDHRTHRHLRFSSKGKDATQERGAGNAVSWCCLANCWPGAANKLVSLAAHVRRDAKQHFILLDSHCSPGSGAAALQQVAVGVKCSLATESRRMRMARRRRDCLLTSCHFIKRASSLLSPALRSNWLSGSLSAPYRHFVRLIKSAPYY